MDGIGNGLPPVEKVTGKRTREVDADSDEMQKKVQKIFDEQVASYVQTITPLLKAFMEQQILFINYQTALLQSALQFQQYADFCGHLATLEASRVEPPQAQNSVGSKEDEIDECLPPFFPSE